MHIIVPVFFPGGAVLGEGFDEVAYGPNSPITYGQNVQLWALGLGLMLLLLQL